MPRFSLGDVGEARWPLSHRWTDTSPILPDVAHDSRNQGRVVSLSVLNLLLACVRLCQLREVHHSLQQELNPWSRTQNAATDGSPACCTSSLMLRATIYPPFRYASPSSSFRCSRKRPSLLSLACASGRLSFAVGEHYYYSCSCVLPFCNLFPRSTYADASFHITIQARSTNTRFTYVQSSTSFYPTTSVPPVSFLILHPRDIQILWSQPVREKPNAEDSR